MPLIAFKACLIISCPFAIKKCGLSTNIRKCPIDRFCVDGQFEENILCVVARNQSIKNIAISVHIMALLALFTCYICIVIAIGNRGKGKAKASVRGGDKFLCAMVTGLVVAIKVAVIYFEGDHFALALKGVKVIRAQNALLFVIVNEAVVYFSIGGYWKA